MRESALTKRILAALNAVPCCVAFKLHGSRFSQAGLPDVIGCYRGAFFGIEVKVGRNRPTALQAHRLQQLSDAGGWTAVAREDFSVREFLEGIGETHA